MSATAIVRALLMQRTALTAIVPATRIFTGVAPQGTPLPAIGVTEISSSEEPTVARLLSKSLVRSRVQVTVYSMKYPEMKQLLLLAKLGTGVHTGNVLGFPVNSVLPAGVGPEIPPGDDKIFEQSRDFVVTFREANL